MLLCSWSHLVHSVFFERYWRVWAFRHYIRNAKPTRTMSTTTMLLQQWLLLFGCRAARRESRIGIVVLVFRMTSWHRRLSRCCVILRSGCTNRWKSGLHRHEGLVSIHSRLRTKRCRTCCMWHGWRKWLWFRVSQLIFRRTCLRRRWRTILSSSFWFVFCHCNSSFRHDGWCTGLVRLLEMSFKGCFVIARC